MKKGYFSIPTSNVMLIGLATSTTRRGVYLVDSEGRGPTQRTLAMERVVQDVVKQSVDFKRYPNVIIYAKIFY